MAEKTMNIIEEIDIAIHLEDISLIQQDKICYVDVEGKSTEEIEQLVSEMK